MFWRRRDPMIQQYIDHLKGEQVALRQQVDRLQATVLELAREMARPTQQLALPAGPAPDPFPEKVQEAIDAVSVADDDMRRTLAQYARSALAGDAGDADSVAAAIRRGADLTALGV